MDGGVVYSSWEGYVPGSGVLGNCNIPSLSLCPKMKSYPKDLSNVPTKQLHIATPLGYANRDLDDSELHFVTTEKPATFSEAEKQECWRKAMIEEIK